MPTISLKDLKSDSSSLVDQAVKRISVPGNALLSAVELYDHFIPKRDQGRQAVPE